MSRHKVCHESKSNVRQFKASDNAPLHLSAVEVKVVVVVGGLQVTGSWGFTALAGDQPQIHSNDLYRDISKHMVH